MADQEKTFSEMWYRVAGHSVTLRPQVRVRRQVFRGERWYILEDPFTNQFYRLRPEAYGFVARLSRERTVDEVWREVLEADPTGAPGQEEVIQLLAQLHHANLLHHPFPVDGEQLFSRYQKRLQRERRMTWTNLMFARFPLFDPDRLLDRARLWVAALMTPWAWAVWGATLLLGAKALLDHSGELRAGVGDILEPSNLLLLYTGIVFLKALHEFGHAAVCKHYGGEVHTLGLMLMLFSPLPYVDVTSSWAFRERRARIAVGAAGMVVELFVAAFAALVWAYSGPGPLKDLAFNMVIAAGVTTVIFNANPLLRYDGYYIASDWLDLPNLYQRGQQMLQYLAQRHLFGVRKAVAPAWRTPTERAWLVGYGVSSLVYRLLVFASLIWFISGRFLLAGMLAALFCFVVWAVVPLGKFVAYLVRSPQLERTRGRTWGVMGGLAAALVVFLGVVPAPHRVKAPGVLRPVAASDVAAGVEGQVALIHAASGQRVEAGAPLLTLTHFQLDQDLRSARGQRAEITALWRDALRSGSSDLAALEAGLKAVEERVKALEDRQAKLVLTAPRAGVWVAPQLDAMPGMWLSRGAVVGQVYDAAQGYEFSAVVSQGEASQLFSNEVRFAEVKLKGQAGEVMKARDWVFVPGEQNRLPSAALAETSGGEVAMARTAKEEPRTAESFYEVKARLGLPVGPTLYSGLTGRLTLGLPAEPLGWQWARLLRQAFQKRASE